MWSAYIRHSSVCDPLTHLKQDTAVQTCVYFTFVVTSIPFKVFGTSSRSNMNPSQKAYLISVALPESAAREPPCSEGVRDWTNGVRGPHHIQQRLFPSIHMLVVPNTHCIVYFGNRYSKLGMINSSFCT
jgi:hypothetical protein